MASHSFLLNRDRIFYLLGVINRGFLLCWLCLLLKFLSVTSDSVTCIMIILCHRYVCGLSAGVLGMGWRPLVRIPLAFTYGNCKSLFELCSFSRKDFQSPCWASPLGTHQGHGPGTFHSVETFLLSSFSVIPSLNLCLLPPHVQILSGLPFAESRPAFSCYSGQGQLAGLAAKEGHGDLLLKTICRQASCFQCHLYPAPSLWPALQL